MEAGQERGTSLVEGSGDGLSASSSVSYDVTEASKTKPLGKQEASGLHGAFVGRVGEESESCNWAAEDNVNIRELL